MSTGWRITYVITLAWVMAMGILVPGYAAWTVYGRFAGVVVGLIGGAIGFAIHRFAWADDVDG